MTGIFFPFVIDSSLLGCTLSYSYLPDLQALNTKNDKEGQYYKEAMLLQAKTCYIQGKFQECLDILDKVMGRQ